jgi:WD40 repeat protein/tetratricopeptide (TPR) repeat protein
MGTDSLDKYDLLDQLAEEFAGRYRRGERPSLKEYIDRYPHLEADLREILPAMVEIEQVEEDQKTAAVESAAPALRQIGDYRMVRQIGRGGMGMVYEAEQLSLDRRVALKVLSPQSIGDARALERFRREARSAARLHHTNIVPVFDVGQEGEVCYYAMQFIQGQSLDQVVQELRRLRAGSEASKGQASGGREPPEYRPLPSDSPLTPGADAPRSPTPGADAPRSPELSHAAQSLLTGRFEARPLVADVTVDASPRPDTPDEAVPASSSSAVLPGQVELSRAEADHHHYFRSVARVGEQTALALAYAHARGIVHRDIKPSNLMLDGSGVVWVTDFGLAKTEDDGLTNTGELPGTLRYMSPERFRGECDVRADIYALGLTLYEMLALKPAFDATDRLRLIDQIGQQEPARLRSVDAQIPRDLETIVHMAIDKEPARRYQCADEMAEDLRRFLAEEPIRARRQTLAERAARWCRRNPAVAALTASVLVLLVAVAVVASVGYVRTSAALGKETEQRAAAEHEREVARTAQAEAIDEAARNRRLLYDADVQLAATLWKSETGTVHAVAELLAGHLPRPGEEDLRDFTWRFQWRLLSDPPAIMQKNPILAAALTPGGDVVGYDGTLLRFWDKTTCRPTGRPRRLALPNFCCCRFSPGCALLALGTTDGRVQLDNPATGQGRTLLQPGAAPLKDVYFSCDGQKLVTIHTDRQARSWDVATGKELAAFTLRLPSGRLAALSVTDLYFRDCALSPDGKTLALAHHPDHSQVALYRVGRAEPDVLQAEEITVSAVAFSPDGRTIATGDSNNQVHLWDASTGRHRDSFTPHMGGITRLAFSPDGTRLATGGDLGFVGVWDLAKRKRLFFFKGYTAGVTGLAFSGDGQWLVSLDSRGTVRPWQLTAQQESRALTGAGPTLSSRLAYSPDGQWLAATGPLTLWDARAGVLVGRLGSAESVAFSPDSKILAWGGSDSRVRLWDVENRRFLRTLEGRPREPIDDRRVIGSLAFSPDGKWLAAGFGHINWFAGGYDQVVKVWEMGSAREAATLLHGGTVPSLAFSADGKTLATACHDGTIQLWSVGSWQQERSWKGATTFGALAFAPGGRVLVTGSGTGALQLWDVATGKLLRPLGRHSDRVFDLAFSPDGKTLASASADQTIKLWDVVSGRELRTLAEHTNSVFGVAFAPGGDALASCSADGSIRVWDTLSRAEVLASWLAQQPQPDSASVRVSRARTYLALNQPQNALAEATRAVELNPDDVPLLLLRANLAACCQKWLDAADDFVKLTGMKGTDAPSPWYPRYRHALALLAAGKIEEYRKACARMVHRFKDTADKQTAVFTAWTAALGPDAVPDFVPVLGLAEKAAASDAQNPLSHLAVGAILYRMGRLEACLKHLDAAEAGPDTPARTSPAYGNYFRAMAHHRLGHKEQARQCLEKAVTQTDKEVRGDAANATPELWVRKATLQLLRAEAEAVLRKASRLSGKASGGR